MGTIKKTKVVYASNGGKVGAGYRQALVEDLPDGTQVLSFMTDDKEGSYSPVLLKEVEEIAVDPDPDPDPVDPDPVDPDPVSGTPVDAANLRDAIVAASGGEVFDVSGSLPDLTLYGLSFTETVTIRGAELGFLLVNTCEGIAFKDCKFSYVYDGEPDHHQPFTLTECKRCSVEGTEIVGSGGPKGYGYAFGLTCDYSEDILIHGNKVSTFLRGIVARSGARITIRENEVVDMSGDGINCARLDGVAVEGNRIHDYRSDPESGFHRDGIQFWTEGDDAPSKDIVISGNVIDIGEGAWTQSIFLRNERVDKGQAGVEMYYQNVLIENNTIKNAHLWGITCGEANGLIIRNNHLERKLNLNNPANEGWGGNWLESVPAIMVHGPYLGEVLVADNSAPRIEIANPAWDGGGNVATGTGPS